MTQTKRSTHYVDIVIRLKVECDEGVDPADIPSYANYEVVYDGEDAKILETEILESQRVGGCDENGILTRVPVETSTAFQQEERGMNEWGTPDEDDTDDDIEDDLQDK